VPVCALHASASNSRLPSPPERTITNPTYQPQYGGTVQYTPGSHPLSARVFVSPASHLTNEGRYLRDFDALVGEVPCSLSPEWMNKFFLGPAGAMLVKLDFLFEVP
jgi:hypothetical protein